MFRTVRRFATSWNVKEGLNLKLDAIVAAQSASRVMINRHSLDPVLTRAQRLTGILHVLNNGLEGQQRLIAAAESTTKAMTQWQENHKHLSEIVAFNRALIKGQQADVPEFDAEKTSDLENIVDCSSAAHHCMGQYLLINQLPKTMRRHLLAAAIRDLDKVVADLEVCREMFEK